MTKGLSGKTTRRIRRVLEYIRLHVHTNVTRSEAAGLINLNEEYFSKVFKTHTGMSFKNYVLSEKMKAAMNLLANTNLSVGLIASNFSHFSKTFKKYTDLSPQEYRRIYQK